MRWDRKEIFIKEMDKLLTAGVPYEQAGEEAMRRSEEIFFDMVDQARQRAKDERRED